MIWLKFKVRYDVFLLKYFKIPINGYALNPLKKFPRNEYCWCGSFLKSKNCCLPKQPNTLPSEMASVAKKYMNYINKVS